MLVITDVIVANTSLSVNNLCAIGMLFPRLIKVYLQMKYNVILLTVIGFNRLMVNVLKMSNMKKKFKQNNCLPSPGSELMIVEYCMVIRNEPTCKISE